MIARIICAVLGHKWKFQHGIRLGKKPFPTLDVHRCERCQDDRTRLFMGGL